MLKRDRMVFDIQKASTLKRASAFLLDLILFAVLAVGAAWLIGLACDYDGLLETNEAYLTQYKAEYETKYGVDFDIIGFCIYVIIEGCIAFFVCFLPQCLLLCTQDVVLLF